MFPILVAFNALAIALLFTFHPYPAWTFDFLTQLANFWVTILLFLFGFAVIQATTAHMRTRLMLFLRSNKGHYTLTAVPIVLCVFAFFGYAYGGGNVIKLGAFQVSQPQQPITGIPNQTSLNNFSSGIRDSLVKFNENEQINRSDVKVVNDSEFNQSFYTPNHCRSVFCMNLRKVVQTLTIDVHIEVLSGDYLVRLKPKLKSIFFQETLLKHEIFRAKSRVEIVHAINKAVFKLVGIRNSSSMTDLVNWGGQVGQCDWRKLNDMLKDSYPDDNTIQQELTKYEEKLKEKPCPENNLLVARGYLKLGKPSQANKYLKEIDEFFKNNPEHTIFASHLKKVKAQITTYSANFEEAEIAWSEYFRSEPTDQENLWWYGVAVWRGAQNLSFQSPPRKFVRENYPKYFAKVEERLVPRVNDDMAAFVLAQMYAASGAPNSDTFYKKAIRLRRNKLREQKVPDKKIEQRLQSFYAGYAYSLYERSQFSDAMQHYKRSLPLQPSDNSPVGKDEVSIQFEGGSLKFNVKNLFFSKLNSLMGFYRSKLESYIRSDDKENVIKTATEISSTFELLSSRIEEEFSGKQVHALEVRARILGLLGYSYLILDQHEKGLEKLEKAIDLESHQGHLFKDANTSHHMACAIVKKGQTDVRQSEYLKYLCKAYALSISNGYTEKKVRAMPKFEKCNR